MKPLSHITTRFTESVIREMTRVSNSRGGINLAQGFPDFDPPEALKKAAMQAILDGHNQYAVTFGEADLRQAIVDKARQYNQIIYDPETEVTVTCGATEAMIATLKAVVNPGDEIIIFEPFYENYGPDAVLSGARPRYVTLRPPDWTYDSDQLAEAFNRNTKAIIINTPNNPSGKVLSRAQLEQVAAVQAGLASSRRTPTVGRVGGVPDGLRREFDLAPFYQKSLRVGALPLVGSAQVSDEALQEAASGKGIVHTWLRAVLATRPPDVPLFSDVRGGKRGHMRREAERAGVPALINFATQVDFLKEAGIGADVLLGNLEDAILVGNKEAARDGLVAVSRDHPELEVGPRPADAEAVAVGVAAVQPPPLTGCQTALREAGQAKVSPST